MTASSAAPDDSLVAALRAGDEGAFRGVVERHHRAMVRVALTFVRSQAVAEEVAQETWLAVIEGLDRFEGRSSLKTWIFRILIRKARARGVRESRSRPISSLISEGEDAEETSPEQFFGACHRWAGHWMQPPQRWNDLPEDRAVARETRTAVLEAIRGMVPAQRSVIALRDIEGWSPREVTELLHLTDVNQRVLLHRARTRVRSRLDRHFRETVLA